MIFPLQLQWVLFSFLQKYRQVNDTLTRYIYKLFLHIQRLPIGIEDILKSSRQNQ